MRISLVALLTVAYAAIAAGDVEVTVWVGAGSTVRVGATIPIVVQLQNDERNRSGVIAAGFAQETLPRTWSAQPLSLAPHARKRVFLYLPFQSMSADRVVVRYETASGAPQAVHEEPLQILPATLPLVAAVGQLPRGLPDPEAGGQPRYRAVILQPDILPPRFEGLEMYDVMLFTPTPDLPLEGEQVAALENWVLRGGTLVVDASRRSDGLQQQDLRRLLPFLPESSEPRSLPDFEKPLLVATGAIHDGKPIWSPGDVPLIVRRNYGLGSIVCFAFDPNDPGFLAHPKHEDLWRDVLGALPFDALPKEFLANGFGEGTVDTVMRRVSDTGGAPTRLGLVVLLTALYALVVGPGDYFLVKRLRRPWLTWITFPAMALAFSAAAYGGARIWFGGETVSRGVQHLTVFPELEKSLSLDAAGLFAGQSGDYDLQHTHQALWRPLQGLFDPEQILTLDPESARVRQRIPVWSHRAYVAGETVSDRPDIQLALEGVHQDDLRVVNHSPYNLADCVVYFGQHMGSCKDIDAGETVSLHLQERPVVNAPGVDNDGKPLKATIKTDTFLLPRPDMGSPMEDMGSPLQMDAPFARELFAGDALRRGALVLRAKVKERGQSPLVVNGTRRTEPTSLDLAVVTYGSASE